MALDIKFGKGQGYSTQLIGQAGVWRVASELALRGHVPLFPGVDYGYDLKLENGLRLQVKASHVKRFHKLYPEGAYAFSTRQFAWQGNNQKLRSTRKYFEVADFFVLWGIEDNKFWIVPTSQFRSGIWFSRSVPNPKNKQFTRMVARRNAFEERWDLLDLDKASSELIESAVEKDLELTKVLEA